MLKLTDVIYRDYIEAKQKKYLIVKYALENIVKEFKLDVSNGGDDKVISEYLIKKVEEKEKKISKYVKRNKDISLLETEIFEKQLYLRYLYNYQNNRNLYIYYTPSESENQLIMTNKFDRWKDYIIIDRDKKSLKLDFFLKKN